MYNFVLDVADGFGHDVKVFVPDNVTERQLQSYNPFCNWKATLRQNLELQHTDENHTFHHDPYVLRSITVQSVDWFGGRIGFVKLSANVQNSRRGTLPGITMLRGGFVSVLMILRPRNTQDERYVLLAAQPRLPAASLQFLEMPSGWISESGDFAGVSAREMEEEMNVKLNSSDLLNLSELAQQYSSVDESFLHKAIYPMAGGSDEFVVIFLWEKELDRQDIEDMRSKLAGQRTQGEIITLRLVDYEDLWKAGGRNAKTLAAWALYEGLSREGIIQRELAKLVAGRSSEANDD